MHVRLTTFRALRILTFRGERHVESASAEKLTRLIGSLTQVSDGIGEAFSWARKQPPGA